MAVKVSRMERHLSPQGAVFSEYIVREVSLMYAIIETGGKQYRVQEGDNIFVEKLAGDVDWQSVMTEISRSDLLLLQAPRLRRRFWLRAKKRRFLFLNIKQNQTIAAVRVIVSRLPRLPLKRLRANDYGFLIS